MDVRMVRLSLGELSDLRGEVEGLPEVLEAELTHQTLDPIDFEDLPSGHLRLQLGDLLIRQGWHAAAAGDACSFGELGCLHRCLPMRQEGRLSPRDRSLESGVGGSEGFARKTGVRMSGNGRAQTTAKRSSKRRTSSLTA